jgi:hypothetical protein
MPLRNGDTIWETVTPATTALSPILGPWVETSGCTQALGWLAVANSTGTTVVTVEYGTDGSTADADFTPVTIAAGANVPFNLYGRYARVRIVQTTADATKTKLYLQAKA